MAVSPSKVSNPRPPPVPPSPESNRFAKQLTSFGKYWLTNKGRNVVGGVAAVTSAGYFVGYVALHSWLLSYYKDAVQLYKLVVRFLLLFFLEEF